MSKPIAAACLRCGTKEGRIPTGSYRPRRRQGYCDTCYDFVYHHGLIKTAPKRGGWRDIPPTIPAVVTPAMLGIQPGQPPIDPDLTPKVVWEIGNKNARRALQWLIAHAGIEETQALARVVWMPAQPDTAARRAA